MAGTIGDDDAHVTLVPRIYGASELGVLSLTAPGEAHPRVEYVGGEVFVGLDHEGEATAVTQGEAAPWPRSFRDVLEAVLSGAPAVPEPVDGAILIDDEGTAASVLIEPARLAGRTVAGDAIAFALTRRNLVVAGADDAAAAARALDLAEQLFDAGGPLVSAHPVVLTADGWRPFPWRERFPSLEMRFERVLRLFGVRAYEVQTAALRRPDIHVANPKIRVLDSGVTTTFATWPKGTATLLPVVDNVIVADPAGALSVATIDEFLDAAGDAVVRTGLSPTRYFVPGERPRAGGAA